jgi:hypothetical protein
LPSHVLRQRLPDFGHRLGLDLGLVDLRLRARQGVLIPGGRTARGGVVIAGDRPLDLVEPLVGDGNSRSRARLGGSGRCDLNILDGSPHGIEKVARLGILGRHRGGDDDRRRKKHGSGAGETEAERAVTGAQRGEHLAPPGHWRFHVNGFDEAVPSGQLAVGIKAKRGRSHGQRQRQEPFELIAVLGVFG